MKKVITFILAGAMALGLASCNSMESDAKELVKRGYEIGKIYKVHDNSKSKFSSSEEKKIRNYTEYVGKMLEKYGKDSESPKKSNQLVENELNNLKSSVRGRK
ncbi:MAG: hypothetical protein LBL90_10375 [Prevotellaceae bacterium]|jgi:hypothetical protein|nr:hypothetical protein [Prevotellaceae bacterium]